MFQYIDLESLKSDFVRENKQEIPPEFSNYADLWEKSANNFVDLFLRYLNRRGLEICFKRPIEQ